MGKKKAVKKTKELSVAIAESSSVDAEGQGGQQEQEQQQQQQQSPTPRKRGRPRKIITVEKTEEEAAGESHDDIEASQSKNVKTGADEEGLPSKTREEAATCTTTTSSSSSKRLLPTRSRARRKSKPRKSS